jgi:hypothetical protein
MKVCPPRKFAKRTLVYLARFAVPLVRWGYRRAPNLSREVAEMFGMRSSVSATGAALSRAMEDASATIELKNSWHRRAD